MIEMHEWDHARKPRLTHLNQKTSNAASTHQQAVVLEVLVQLAPTWLKHSACSKAADHVLFVNSIPF